MGQNHHQAGLRQRSPNSMFGLQKLGSDIVEGAFKMFDVKNTVFIEEFKVYGTYRGCAVLCIISPCLDQDDYYNLPPL